MKGMSWIKLKGKWVDLKQEKKNELWTKSQNNNIVSDHIR